jgi:hypothetical protein
MKDMDEDELNVYGIRSRNLKKICMYLILND